MSVTATRQRRQRSDRWRHELAGAFADLQAESHEGGLPDGSLADAHFDDRPHPIREVSGRRGRGDGRDR